MKAFSACLRHGDDLVTHLAFRSLEHVLRHDVATRLAVTCMQPGFEGEWDAILQGCCGALEDMIEEADDDALLAMIAASDLAHPPL